MTTPSLAIITYLYPQPMRWRQLGIPPYSAVHVNALYNACKAKIHFAHRFICVTNQTDGIECETRPCPSPITIDNNEGCYRRLHAFSDEFAAELEADYYAMIDLDVVLNGDCTDIFRWAMQRDFVILRGSPRAQGDLCNLYNGGFWVCKRGARTLFWEATKDPDISRRRRAYRLPSGKRAVGSDQALMAMISPHEQVMGIEHGIYQYRYHHKFDREAKMIFFAGVEKPWDRKTLIKHPEVYKAWAKYAKTVPDVPPADPPSRGDRSNVNFVTFLWGHRYSSEHVNSLADQLARNMEDMPYRLICVTDKPHAELKCETAQLWSDYRKMVNPAGPNFPNCYPRLKLFNRDCQKELGIEEGAKVCCTDLDMAIVAPCSSLFDRCEPFLGWRVKGARQNTVYNGSLWMFRAGLFTEIWDEFDPLHSPRRARSRGYFGSDQAILSNELISERGYRAGWTRQDGIVAYREIRGNSMPPELIRVIGFYGRWKPWDVETLRQTPWLKSLLPIGSG